MHNVGLPQDWIIAECFGLDDECLSFVPQPALAVIAVIESLEADKGSRDLGDVTLPVDFYMKQTPKLDCACGIIACIHSVLNNTKHIALPEDSVLGKFQKSCEGKTPEHSAKLLEDNNEFKSTHSGFAAQGQSEQAQDTESVKYHFIAFVRSEEGKLIEYDGLKQGPLVVQEASEDLLKDTARILLKRVEDGKYSESISV
jgi:ubiquitin carboxyl-terminal hydrolase L3